VTVATGPKADAGSDANVRALDEARRRVERALRESSAGTLAQTNIVPLGSATSGPTGARSPRRARRAR
jgi:hypothetical protein